MIMTPDEAINNTSKNERDTPKKQFSSYKHLHAVFDGSRAGTEFLQSNIYDTNSGT
jgi:hypothetical protein